MQLVLPVAVRFVTNYIVAMLHYFLKTKDMKQNANTFNLFIR